MSSINAGKQDQVSFNWYKGNIVDSIKDVRSQPTSEVFNTVTPTLPSSYDINATELLPSNFDQTRSLPSITHDIPLPQVPSSHSLLEAAITQDFHPDVDRLQLDSSPMEPSRIRSILYLSPFGSAYTEEFNPVTDQVRTRSPREPSKIRRHSLGSQPYARSPVAVKHPHPLDSPSVQRFEEMPLKRVKFDQQSWTQQWDFTPIDGFEQFERQSGMDKFAWEESEREYQMSRRVDPIVSGKLHNVQKELMSRINNPTFLRTAPVAKVLAGSVASIKDAILEKGHSLIDSSRDALKGFNAHPLRNTLNSIAADAENGFRPLSLGGEKIDFVWPRVPESVKDAEELARSERTSQGVSPVLFGKWKSLNTEFNSKWGSSGFVFAKSAMAKNSTKKSLIDSASALVGKATHAIEDAVEYTSGMMENLGLKSVHDAEWFNMQEEKERARRINQDSVLSPGLDCRKSKLENQLLKTVNALKPKSEF